MIKEYENTNVEGSIRIPNEGTIQETASQGFRRLCQEMMSEGPLDIGTGRMQTANKYSSRKMMARGPS